MGDKKLITVCNFSKSEQKFDFTGYENAKVLISNYGVDIRDGGILKPYSAVVMLLDKS